MLSKEEIKNLAEERGFTHWATLGGSRLQFMDRWGINLFVNIEKEEFEFAWMIPKSIFQIICPSCSPFSNNEHFSKMYRNFKKTVRTMQYALEEEEI